MQEAIEQEYVVRAERLRQEASAAWAHVTASKADAWLARLEAGEDVMPPECPV
ncbi:MAG TPA: hypothetical protein VG124_07055 [Beijerinckiaceae bacterium]|jgi:hypothetical protein|nr:hypothetical protein [Beijerinckiaceae bacterium]